MILNEGKQAQWELSDVAVVGGPASGRAADLPEVERQAIQFGIEGRQQEFAAGRRYAREALSALGLPSASLPRRTAGDPQWPSGVIGSISHGGGLCVAMTGRTGMFASLGVDIEPARPLEPEIWEEVCSAVELVWVHAARLWDPGILALMLLCAKEAAYKAQFPLTDAFIDFAAATTRLNPFTGSFDIILAPDVQALLGPRHIKGVAARSRGYVVAVART